MANVMDIPGFELDPGYASIVQPEALPGAGR